MLLEANDSPNTHEPVNQQTGPPFVILHMI